MCLFFFFSSRRRHTRSTRDWSSDVCSSDLGDHPRAALACGVLRPLERTSRRERGGHGLPRGLSLPALRGEAQLRAGILVPLRGGRPGQRRLRRATDDRDGDAVPARRPPRRHGRRLLLRRLSPRVDPPCTAAHLPDPRSGGGLVAQQRDGRHPPQALRRGDEAFERGDRRASGLRAERHGTVDRGARRSFVTPVAYDHFYEYDELSATLQAWASESHQLCSVVSIGQSFEGRDIWLVTVTNSGTGDHLDKPAFLIEANIHSMEWTGCTAALHLIHRLVSAYGSDEQVTRALDTRTFYVIPRLNPDGAERGLKERRFIRSSVRPYPREQQDDGLHVQDVDGDGRVLDMRIEDPNGAWRPHPEENALLVRRDPVDESGDGPFYRLMPEGRVQNYDGVTIKVPPPLEGSTSTATSRPNGRRSTSSAE